MAIVVVNIHKHGSSTSKMIFFYLKKKKDDILLETFDCDKVL